jgi:dual specificity tyrosine-phosphorylation-regulated kinase 2/3/4
MSLNMSLGTPKRSLVSSLSKGPDIESTNQPEVVYPISAAQALKLFHSQLSEFEQSEILELQQIFFLGLNAVKTRCNAAMVNYGYDDDRGDYKIVQGDHIQYRYEVLGTLGKGSFGQVCKCFDHKNKETVALKIIRNKKRFHQQGVVEVKVLDHLRAHDIEDKMCVVKMKNYFVFRKHLCLSFELLSINLYDFLKSNEFAGLSLNLVRRFAIQLIIALRYVKANHIIHCDLKPENILLKQANKSGVKVIDFGSSCFENERVYTYIQSRFYRAPEIMLGVPYTPCIDMWSLGCILAELSTGYPLFPGESEHEQILCIMEVLGVPPQSLLVQSTRKRLFFDGENGPKLITNSRGKRRIPGTKTIQGVLKSSDPAFTDFVTQCLTWNPETRLTPDAALKHQWIVEGITKMQEAAEQNERKRSTPKACDKMAAVYGKEYAGHKH